VSVGVSLKKSVVGVGVFLSIMYSKCCYQRGARYCTYARPSEQSSPHTRSLEEGEGMGGGTTDTASEYGRQVPSHASKEEGRG